MGRRVRRRDPEKERSWRRRLLDWRRSGLCVHEFCDWQAVSEASFYAWRRELTVRDRGAAAGGEGPANNSESNPPPFLPVQVVTDALRESGGVAA